MPKIAHTAAFVGITGWSFQFGLTFTLRAHLAQILRELNHDTSMSLA
jgi:hypothetical protein